MNQEKLKSILQKGEGDLIEFKENFGDEVIISLTAFSNFKGGKVLLGVNDKGKIKGVQIGKESLQKWTNEIKNKTYPFLMPMMDIIEIRNKKVLVFTVKESPIKPIAFKNRYFIRKENSNQIMSFEESFNLGLQTYNLSWDKFLVPKIKFSDLDEDKILRFVNLLKENGLEIEDPLTVLNKFRLIEEGGVTFAAFLLFSKKAFPNSCVHLVKFLDDNSREEAIDDVYLETDLISQVEKIINFIKINIRKGLKKSPAEIKITHDTIWEYPLDAIRELVINLVVHRDYKSSSPALVFIYNHKIEFWNAGEISEDITMEAIKNNSYSPCVRNHLLVRVFKELGIIQNLGSGLKKVYDIFEKNNIEMRVERFAKGSKIILEKKISGFAKGVPENVPEVVLINVPENRLEIVFDLIKKNKKITIFLIAKKLSVNEKTVKRDIAKLKQKKLLKRIGPAKGGHWEVLN